MKNFELRFYNTIWHFITAFTIILERKKKAICDRIWVVEPKYDHTLSVNNIIASIQSGTENNVNFRKMMKI